MSGPDLGVEGTIVKKLSRVPEHRGYRFVARPEGQERASHGRLGKALRNESRDLEAAACTGHQRTARRPV